MAKRMNIFLKYALLYDKTAKDIALDCKISLKTTYRILKGYRINKLDIANRLSKYLKIPYKEFERYWRKI